jgi:hypothetical protein
MSDIDRIREACTKSATKTYTAVVNKMANECLWRYKIEQVNSNPALGKMFAEKGFFVDYDADGSITVYVYAIPSNRGIVIGYGANAGMTSFSAN